MLTWGKSTDNVGVTSYLVYRGGTRVASVSSSILSYTDSALSVSTTYSYTVKARDAAGNLSAASNPASATTQAAAVDTTPPSVPADLTATPVSSSEIDLNWTASFDDVGGRGLDSYKVYRGVDLIATVPAATTSFADTDLAAATTFGYSVSAQDLAGNTSATSTVAYATTLAISSVNTAAPVVSGVGTVGLTLTTSDGTWSGSAATYAYQWQRCDSAGANCAGIAGATSNSVLLAAADQGMTMRSVVTASNSAGSNSATSASTATIQASTISQGVSYYVDCLGTDGNAGLSPSSPWKTLAKANQATVRPGESLLLKRGCTWNEQLVAKWAGTSTSPVLIGAYGSGSDPLIQRDAKGTSTNLAAVSISGSYQIIEHIRVRVINPWLDSTCLQQDGSAMPHGWYAGFSLGGTSSHNTLRNLDASSLSVGITLSDLTHHNMVADNYLHDMHYLWALQKDAGGALGSIGINLHGNDGEFTRNLAERNGGYCTYGDGTVSRYSAAFEVYNANRNYVHHNWAFGHRKHFEMGHDSTSTTDDNVLAYNLFVSDAIDAVGPNIHGSGSAFGPVNRTQIYNNTIIFTGANSQSLVCGCSGGATVRSNIFAAEWKAAYYQGTVTESNNIYWDYQKTSDAGTDPLVQFNVTTQTSMDGTSMKLDPLVVDPLNNWHLQAGSPAGLGDVISANDPKLADILSYDLDGKTTAWSIGAYVHP
jgi:hypothetical protein